MMQSDLDSPDNADIPAHHMNMMADWAIAPYRAPGVILTREAACQIVDGLSAPHEGLPLGLCVTASPYELQLEVPHDQLVDARPGSDLGRLLAVCFYLGDCANVDLATREFESEENADRWIEEVIKPFIDRAKFSSDTKVL